MVKFSIITCTFNAGPYIGRTMESVKEQVYPYIEHIIMDGVSRDRTLTVVEQYAAVDSRVKLFSERDNGLYDAMNKAIQRATGDYILFLNAGDRFFSETTLEDIADMLKYNNRPAVVYGMTDIVNNAGMLLHPRRLQPPEVLTWKSFRHGMLVCHQAFFARTDIAKETPYNLKYRFSADVDWCIRIMKKGEDLGEKNLNTHLTVCDYLDGGMTNKNHWASLKERFKVMLTHYGITTTLIMHAWFATKALGRLIRRKAIELSHRIFKKKKEQRQIIQHQVHRLHR